MQRPDIIGICRDIAAGKIPEEPTTTLIEYLLAQEALKKEYEEMLREADVAYWRKT